MENEKPVEQPKGQKIEIGKNYSLQKTVDGRLWAYGPNGGLQLNEAQTRYLEKMFAAFMREQM